MSLESDQPPKATPPKSEWQPLWALLVILGVVALAAWGVWSMFRGR